MRALDLSGSSKEQIEDLIIEGADLPMLYRIDVFLERKMSYTHGELTREKKDEIKRTSLKNMLSWCENMIAICKKRQDDVRAGNNAYNYNFRLEAEKILPPELYKKIADAVQR